MINDDCWPTTTTTTVLELGTQCKTNQGLLNMKNPPVSTSRLHWYNNHEPTKIRGRVYIIKKEKELMMKSPDKSCRRFKTLAFSCSRLAPFCRAKVSQDKIENRPTTLFPPLSLSTYPTSWKKKKQLRPCYHERSAITSFLFNDQHRDRQICQRNDVSGNHEKKKQW